MKRSRDDNGTVQVYDGGVVTSEDIAREEDGPSVFRLCVFTFAHLG